MLWGSFALTAMVCLAYLPVFNSGFIWDDDQYVIDNELLRSTEGLGKIWFELGATSQYYPLVYSTFWMEYQAWGLWGPGYHAGNVLLHATAAVLLWRLLRRLKMPGAFLAAAVFAVHPVCVESVAWITERKNVLMLSLGLGSALAWWRYANPPSPGNRGRWWLVLSLGLFLLALFSKTVIASLPAVLVILMWMRHRRLERRHWLSLAGLLLLGLAMAMVTVYVERVHVRAVGADWDRTVLQRINLAGRALWFYVAQILWPVNLSFIYPRWAVESPALWTWLCWPAALAVTAEAFFFRRRVGRGPVAALLIYGGTLLPALGFVNIYMMRFTFVSDHWQYLSCPALIALLVGGLCVFWRRWGPKPSGISAAIGLVVLLGVLSFRQARAYRNHETFYTFILQRNPNAWLARVNLGLMRKEQGRYDEAEHHLRRAVELRPGTAESHYNYASLLIRMGRLDKAEDSIHRALEIQPADIHAKYNLAFVYWLKKQYQQTADTVVPLATLRPNDADIRGLAGLSLAALKRPTEAIPHLQEALRLAPESRHASHWRYRLGQAFHTTGKDALAIQELRNVLASHSPRYRQDAMNSLAWVLATSRDPTVRRPQEALRLAEELIQQQNDTPPAALLDTLAAAQAACGNARQAEQTQRQAIQRLQVEGSGENTLEAYRQRLEEYRKSATTGNGTDVSP